MPPSVRSCCSSWYFPHIPGFDVAGVIAEVGEGAGGWKAGDAVVAFLPMNRPGAAATFGAGQGLAEAGVGSGAEDEVRVGAAAQVHLLGVVEDVLVPVGGGHVADHGGAARQCPAADLRVLGEITPQAESEVGVEAAFGAGGHVRAVAAATASAAELVRGSAYSGGAVVGDPTRLHRGGAGACLPDGCRPPGLPPCRRVFLSPSYPGRLFAGAATATVRVLDGRGPPTASRGPADTARPACVSVPCGVAVRRQWLGP